MTVELAGIKVETVAEAADEAAEAPQAPEASEDEQRAWKLREAILVPKVPEHVTKGLSLLRLAEEFIRVGEVEQGQALQQLGMTYIHLS